MDVGDQDRLRLDAAKLHAILNRYGITNSLTTYRGTHTRAVAYGLSRTVCGRSRGRASRYTAASLEWAPANGRGA